jgi:alpha-N-arabinofuranosidase
MPTIGAWEATVLEHACEQVDYLSCHAYYEQHDGDAASFLASAVDMDGFIDAVVATADHVRAKKRARKRIDISFDADASSAAVVLPPASWNLLRTSGSV